MLSRLRESGRREGAAFLRPLRGSLRIPSTAMSTTRADYVFFNTPITRAERIARLETLANLLDTAILIPGTNIRFGADAIIGLVPGLGDLVTTALSLYIVREARALGAPRHLVLRMLGNVAVDGIVGVVPLAGDVLDVMWRANRRNMDLLRAWLQKH